MAKLKMNHHVSGVLFTSIEILYNQFGVVRPSIMSVAGHMAVRAPDVHLLDDDVHQVDC